MNYNDFFRSALSAAYKKAPMTDDDTFMSIIKERAKNMKKDDNVKQMKFTEITPEYIEPKKSHKAISVVAGIAGTAAVLTGAVFGLNWLNEHGGMKEGGIESSNGAGYSQNAETTTTDLPYTEPNGIVTTTAVEHITDYYTSFTAFDLGDYKVSITGYEFNTVLLRLYYTVERNDGGAITETEAFGSVAWHGTDGKYAVINHAVTTSKGTSVSFIVDIIPEELTHSLEVDIINSESQIRGTYIAKCDNSNYVFRLPCDVEGVDPHISELFVSQSEMILKYKTTDVNDVDFELPSVEVYMKGNYPISCSDAKNNWYDTARNVGYVLRGFSEPCDTSNIGRVYVGDVLVYEAPDIQYPAAVTSAYAATQERIPDTQETGKILEIPQGDLSLIEGIYPPGYEPPYEVIEGSEDPVNSGEVVLPEFPTVIGNNEFYGELLETPITGDEAWELVKERGGIDYDYPFPYDKSIFKFTGTEFCIDYADFDVTALVGGTVEFAGWYNGWGNSVLILDDNGHYWLWGHLAKELNVAEGDTVEAGAKIGHTGSSGYALCQCYAMRVG